LTEPADVTVIMPAYRAAGTIARALHSVAAQTVRPRAVVVVDDGSDDGTVEAAKIAFGDGTLTLLTQAHAGAGAARNRALRQATTKYVAFLDADDEWMPDKLAISLAHLARGGFTFVAHDMLVENGGVEQRADCARHHPAGGDAFAALFRRGYVATSTVVARRDAIKAAGGFDESLLSGQDYELWLRLAATPGVSFAVFPGAHTRYHVTNNSITRDAERRRAASLTIMRRHLRTLRARDPAAFSTALTRTAIIAVEAAAEHVRAGRPLAGLRSLAQFVGDALATAAAFARAA
jgi:glycosyltransferase involved in cell wall biosynthesis